MNYSGFVSSVNGTMWTFKLNGKVTIHMGHLAACNADQLLPEVGENVEIYNAHYVVNKYLKLDALVLCEESIIICDRYKNHSREDELLKILRNHNLGISDLLEINYNIPTIETFIKDLTSCSLEQIVLEVLRCIASWQPDLHKKIDCAHKCLNEVLPIFTLRTVSFCQYVDLPADGTVEGPVWNFGTHSKADKSNMLIGFLHINKRFGIVLLSDVKHNIPCLITTKNKDLDKKNILNKFVIIRRYRIFTESYREPGTPSLEYILFDMEDVLTLNINTSCQDIFSKSLPERFPYIYNLKFKLLKKASVSINMESKIECWLEVLINNDSNIYCAYLGLNAYQVQVMPYLEEGKCYQVYHWQKLQDCNNLELSRIKKHNVSQKFIDTTSFFINDVITAYNFPTSSDVILNVPQAIEKIKEVNLIISFQGLLSVKKLTPAISSRTRNNIKHIGFGTPGSKTHTLIFVDDKQERSLLLYLNNWEKLRLPLGLIPFMRLCVRNVLPQKNKYLKSTSMTTFEVLSYEPPIFFDTVNLSKNPTCGCNKYSFLGWGDLLPSNVLVWAYVLQLYVRSLKITYKCENCSVLLTSGNCSCGSRKPILETVLTLIVYDQMGQALIISKSTKLLRLLLGLESRQWNIWCSAFEYIGEYIYSTDEEIHFSNKADVNAFRETLTITINTLNTMRISNLELKCRRMENNPTDGTPTWFCIDAREREDEIL